MAAATHEELPVIMANREQAWTRSIFGALLDRAISWAYGLYPEKCNYKAEPFRIPVSSGLSRIELAATFYAPLLSEDVQPEGTILVHGPYGRGLPVSGGFARLYASRGYQVLFVSCRGTFGSGCEFDPFLNEVEDGKAVVYTASSFGRDAILIFNGLN
ncbi:hypothetical protein K458DRAFT_382492 [Lentithecium fluviatile CBS 122367]|uniref:Xaa-Pro dipeptidyl-peptidase-like domain-containing protein n=1 Tax=Lentithecium fluviatile CBS 122367 TaxID=1168545 RepID=A0A6G1JK22_9PLEO|nr:hypothetical protein K458DRAFT_382492 [Lentithecium fluviatile CBS 122367]